MSDSDRPLPVWTQGAAPIVRGVGAAALAALRLSLLAVLVVLEPFVRAGLTLLAALAVFFAFFFEVLVRLPHFPFLGMLGFATACALLLLAYQLVIRILSGAGPAGPPPRP